MIYASAADFQSALPERDLIRLTNPGNTAATAINVVRLTAEAERQSQVMDSYFGGRATLPLPLIPPPAITCCIWLTIHALDSQRTRADVRQRYEDWMKWLEGVAAGRISLGLPESAPDPTPVGQPVAFAGVDRFGEIDIGSW